MSDRSGFVVVDTTIFSAVLAPAGSEVPKLYADDAVGKKWLVSFQTTAEIRYGALSRGWGESRLAELEQHLESALEVPPHEELTKEWAVLRYECKKAGHAFHQKGHAADLWIDATAALAGVPLLTHDAGFRGVPGLEVICHA